MSFPLSKFGITKEEKHLLQDRLNPDVNRIFLESIAKKNKISYDRIEELDYENNEIFKHNQFIKRRELNAKRNLPINKEAGTTETKWETFEEAKANDLKSHHILLEDEHPRGGTEKGFSEDEKERKNVQFCIDDEKDFFIDEDNVPTDKKAWDFFERDSEEAQKD